MQGCSRPSHARSLRDAQALDRYDLAENLRDHVQKAGVQRPQLFAMDGKRIWLRAHDLRASFVTVSLANGKTESWVADRTGHLSSTMINRCKRWARGHKELNLGDFIPLVEAIPELLAAPDWTVDRDDTEKKNGNEAAE